MRTLNLRYEDKDWNKLKTAKEKSGWTWERFILTYCTEQKIPIMKFKQLKGGLENGNNNDKQN